MCLEASHHDAQKWRITGEPLATTSSTSPFDFTSLTDPPILLRLASITRTNPNPFFCLGSTQCHTVSACVCLNVHLLGFSDAWLRDGSGKGISHNPNSLDNKPSLSGPRNFRELLFSLPYYYLHPYFRNTLLIEIRIHV